MGDIKVLKLISGEDIVAEVNGFNVKNPLRILIIPEQGKLMLMPWLGFVNTDNVTLRDTHIMYIAEASEDIRNTYNEKFGSGVITSSNQLVVPGMNV